MNTTITAESRPSVEDLAPTFHEDLTRCQFHFANGKRCRFPGSQAGFCSRHQFNAPLAHTIDDSIDLSGDLLPELSESSAFDLNQFLLLVQLTKGRVSPRRAWVLSCISNQLIHSHRRSGKENIGVSYCLDESFSRAHP